MIKGSETPDIIVNPDLTDRLVKSSYNQKIIPISTGEITVPNSDVLQVAERLKNPNLT